MDAAGQQPVAQRRRAELVVDAPPHVLRARRAAIGPPRVVLALGVQLAEGVDPARRVAAQAVEPIALARQAAGVLLVRLPVAEVELRCDDVPVAAQHVVAPAVQPVVQDRRKPLHHLELEALALLARGAGREVERHDTQVPEPRLEVAPFVVERRPAQAGAHFVRLAPRIDRHAAVALLRVASRNQRDSRRARSPAPPSWCSCALVSCTHRTSASCVRNQSKNPLLAAERTPLALKLTMRKKRSPCME